MIKLKLEVLKSDFQRKKDTNTDKLAINWQNFVQVRLQLKFAFIIRPYDIYVDYLHCILIKVNSYFKPTAALC